MYNNMLALLERNNVDGTNHATNMAKGGRERVVITILQG
jgi:hypothetical protein